MTKSCTKGEKKKTCTYGENHKYRVISGKIQGVCADSVWILQFGIDYVYILSISCIYTFCLYVYINSLYVYIHDFSNFIYTVYMMYIYMFFQISYTLYIQIQTCLCRQNKNLSIWCLYDIQTISPFLSIQHLFYIDRKMSISYRHIDA